MYPIYLYILLPVLNQIEFVKAITMTVFVYLHEGSRLFPQAHRGTKQDFLVLTRSKLIEFMAQLTSQRGKMAIRIRTVAVACPFSRAGVPLFYLRSDMIGKCFFLANFELRRDKDSSIFHGKLALGLRDF